MAIINNMIAHTVQPLSPKTNESTALLNIVDCFCTILHTHFYWLTNCCQFYFEIWPDWLMILGLWYTQHFGGSSRIHDLFLQKVNTEPSSGATKCIVSYIILLHQHKCFFLYEYIVLHIYQDHVSPRVCVRKARSLAININHHLTHRHRNIRHSKYHKGEWFNKIEFGTTTLMHHFYLVKTDSSFLMCVI